MALGLSGRRIRAAVWRARALPRTRARARALSACCRARAAARAARASACRARRAAAAAAAAAPAAPHARRRAALPPRAHTQLFMANYGQERIPIGSGSACASWRSRRGSCRTPSSESMRSRAIRAILAYRQRTSCRALASPPSASGCCGRGYDVGRELRGSERKSIRRLRKRP